MKIHKDLYLYAFYTLRDSTQDLAQVRQILYGWTTPLDLTTTLAFSDFFYSFISSIWSFESSYLNFFYSVN